MLFKGVPFSRGSAFKSLMGKNEFCSNNPGACLDFFKNFFYIFYIIFPRTPLTPANYYQNAPKYLDPLEIPRTSRYLQTIWIFCKLRPAPTQDNQMFRYPDYPDILLVLYLSNYFDTISIIITLQAGHSSYLGISQHIS